MIKKQIIINYVIIAGIMTWLLTLPLMTKVHHLYGYYGVLLVVFGSLIGHQAIKLKQGADSFYDSWKKKREKGMIRHCVIASLKYFVVIAGSVMFGQYYINGISINDIQPEMTNFQVVVLLIVAATFSVIIGIRSWYENEKRYFKEMRGK